MRFVAIKSIGVGPFATDVRAKIKSISKDGAAIKVTFSIASIPEEVVLSEEILKTGLPRLMRMKLQQIISLGKNRVQRIK
jgi:hypothetical protein